MNSREFELSRILKELRRVAGLPAIEGASAAPSTEWLLANIYEVVTNWSPGIALDAIVEDILPAEDNTYNLGSAVKRWVEGHFSKVFIGDDGLRFEEKFNSVALISPQSASEAANLFGLYGNNGTEPVFEIQTDGDGDVVLRNSAIFSFLNGSVNTIFKISGEVVAIQAPLATPQGVLSAIGLDGTTPYISFPHHVEFIERADPTAPSANRALLYAKDNGAAKTQLVVRFPTGAVQILATEP